MVQCVEGQSLINMLQFSKPQIEIYNSTKQRNLFLAGQGSGKSFMGAVVAMKYITQFPNAIGFVGANSYNQLSKSTLKRIFDTWFQYWGLKNGVHYVVDKQPMEDWPELHSKLKSYDNTISFNNGALIFLASLENYQQIDGVELGWAILDETKDTREEAVKEVIVARLRQKAMYLTETGEITTEVTENGFNPLYILTSPAKVKWINEWFGLENYYEEINQRIFSETDFFKLYTERQLVVISSTFHNKRNLPSNFIQGLMEDHAANPHLIDMNIYGSPIAKSGGEFYHQFNRLAHVKETKYDRNLALHVTFDFNVKPYITAQIWQISIEDARYKVRGIREYAFTPPKNNSESLASAIFNDYYEQKKHRGSAFIYGDASGKNRNTISMTFSHNYEVIEFYLKEMLTDSSMRVAKRNLPVVKRRDFCNNVLFGKFPIDIEIDPSMTKTITDFEFVKEGPDGGKKKDVSLNRETGEYEEKYGHMGDAFEYFICKAFDDYFYKLTK